jgi:hypothetical protein
MKKFIFAVLFSFAIFSMVGFSQTKTRKPSKKSPKPTVTTTPTPSNSNPQAAEDKEPVKTPTKKNERPTNGNSNNQTVVKNETAPNYFYEFSQPNFVVSKIFIEHDENGKGKITFMKKDWEETDSDPIQISATALERIKNAFAELDFLNSTENYQYEKDYPHLGNIVIKLRRDGRERETKFNWTQNPKARILYDEYRKIGNQFLWVFDMNVARVNQPLDAPKLMDLLDRNIQRNEISDSVQMIPFLKELANDERIPLIARNHALRLITEIEKKSAKK